MIEDQKKSSKFFCELESILSNVNRPGSFCTHGSMEMPLPKVEVKGTGILSFPLQSDQANKLINKASQAPFGRGEKTIVDTSVRKVWQISPDDVALSGASWALHFQEILSKVKTGLGCQDISVRAELYKMLVYTKGGFFLSHRDTEKEEGMFGTLVIVLPSIHSGGELIIRHAGKEVSIDFSQLEVSEIGFAAFYADCEHEVQPIIEGNRVCLIYNLIRDKNNSKEVESLKPPMYELEIDQMSDLIEKGFSEDEAPEKIVWLLEHQYTQAELSFQGLKNGDLAISNVLKQAADKASSVIHLGIVHIEESGSAEPDYDPYYNKRKWGRACDDYDSGFEVIEVFDREQYIDSWINPQGAKTDFGKMPFEDGELLPENGLEDEEPDEQRLLGSTGNEGASFERSYHRAALVIWRKDKYVDVLLKSGVENAIAYLKKYIDSCDKEFRNQAIHMASQIIDVFENGLDNRNLWRNYGKGSTRSKDMLQLLLKLHDIPMIDSFISRVVVFQYDGAENEPLIQALYLLEEKSIKSLLGVLLEKRLPVHPLMCIKLINQLILDSKLSNETLCNLANQAVLLIPDLEKRPANWNIFRRRQDENGRDGDYYVQLMCELWNALASLKMEREIELISAEFIKNEALFQPRDVIVPALAAISKTLYNKQSQMAVYMNLWEYVSKSLLSSSEFPPELPKNWKQDVKIKCTCEDCKELQDFANDPVLKTYHFRVKKERRQHLHGIINDQNLDITHITERSGSPQTLVCTKTRDSFKRKCGEYALDIAAAKEHLKSILNVSESLNEYADRLLRSIERSNSSSLHVEL
jgi:hypothetical protein